ncbi:hypothetical protein BJ170DRAFT_242765 [Xylariales sp. AK1849]|nr:hypothetical protein BJ170DRAFT_242765 [Xylariales sp. AK1849]
MCYKNLEMARILLAGLWLGGQALAQFTAPAVINNAVNAITTGAGYSACVTAEAAIQYCSSAIPDFDHAPYSDVAGCLCCSGTSYEPDYFDEVAETCASYISTALPKSTSQYSAYSTLGSFCDDEGSQNICRSAGSGSITATQTASAFTSVPTGCSSVIEIFSECAGDSESFYSAPSKSQAACYCYQSDSQTISWVPDYFDGFASECAAWAKTADTDDYSAYSQFATLCDSYGDFLTAGGTTTIAKSTTTKSTTTKSSSRTSSTPTAAQTGQGTGSTTQPTAVTVTVAPSTTSTPGTNAANGLGGQALLSGGIVGVIMALVL